MVNSLDSISTANIKTHPRFDNQVVLVTGATQGIGFAIAKLFLREGAKVALNDINPKRIETALETLAHFENERLLACPADVSNATQCHDMVEQIVAHWGQIDIVVNNAGIYPSHLVLDMKEEDWDAVMNTNTKGVFLVSQAVARFMVKQNIRGHIINIASGSYHRGRVGSAHYCASKAAAVMFTKVLAMELAPHGIRVNALAPGLIDTGTLNLDEGYINNTIQQIPVGRLGQSEDVAEAVIGLAAIDSDYITGAVLAVDGGLALGRYGIAMA